MSENPLDPSPEFEQRVRERAYHLWEREGRPEGQDLEYWERARELEAMASNPDTALLPNPIEADHGWSPSDEPVEEAQLMENLGEFPGRTTDQGDRQETPMTRQQASRARRAG